MFRVGGGWFTAKQFYEEYVTRHKHNVHQAKTDAALEKHTMDRQLHGDSAWQETWMDNSADINKRNMSTKIEIDFLYNFINF